MHQNDLNNVLIVIFFIGYETAIGYNDVKTNTGVYFYVKRNSFYSATRMVIAYQVEDLNIGGAMHLAGGVFTAPVKGRYHFSFSGHAHNGDTWVGLRLNSAFTAISATPKHGALSITATLNLNQGDRVDTYLDAGSIDSDNNHYTVFSGVLLEQDLTL